MKILMTYLLGLISTSIILNQLILAFALYNGYSVDSLSATVYTFIFCPVFVAPSALLIGVIAKKLLQHRNWRSHVILLCSTSILLGAVQAHFFPMKELDREQYRKLPDIRDYLRSND